MSTPDSKAASTLVPEAPGAALATVVPEDPSIALPPQDAGDSQSVSMLSPGDKVGKFVVKRQIGRGGMGMVYLAHDPAIDREVAIKVLRPDAADGEAAERFRSEARAAGRLSHPNVVAVFEIGEENGLTYIAMEYASGGSVGDLLRGEKPVPPVRSVEMLADACAGLAAAHEEGIVHRDVKPANLLLDEDGAVKVADFGLARRASSGDPRLTQAANIVGTPYYMSPEQCGGGDLDARSDVYSLGATFHTMLTGHTPFGRSGTAMDVLAAHMYEPRPSAHEEVDGVPESCTRVVQKAMAKNPEERYPTAAEMLADVERLLSAMRRSVVDSESSIVQELDESAVDELMEASDVETDMTPGVRKTHAEKPPASIVTSRTPGIRREVFSVSGGEVTVTYPRRIKLEDRETLEEWWKLMRRKMVGLIEE